MKKRLYTIIILLMLFISTLAMNFIPSAQNNPIKKMDIITTFSVKNGEPTLYVDDDNTAGPWDGSIHNPYRNIQDAIDSAIYGDHIYVFEGTYYENIEIRGQDKNNIIIEGEKKNTTIIDGNDNPGVHTISVADVENINLTTLTITGSGQDHSNSQYLYAGIYCDEDVIITIYNTIIKDNGNGIRGETDSTLIIQNNEINDNLCDGIRGHSEFIIIGNHIENNGFGQGPVNPQGDGISLWDSAKDSIIRDNYIINNRVDGIWDEGVDDHIIEGNVLIGNGQSAIHLNEGRDCIIRNNTIRDNGYSSDIKKLNGAGILLYQSTYNTIESNVIEENKKGIELRESQSNVITKNNITDNYAGIYLIKTSATQVSLNRICHNYAGLCMVTTYGATISKNDICYNKICQLFSIIGFGMALNNYWGSVWGPWTAVTIRIPPPLPFFTPCAHFSFFDSPISIDNEAFDTSYTQHDLILFQDMILSDLDHIALSNTIITSSLEALFP